MLSRLARIRVLFDSLAADVILITNPENRRYLSGFSGSSGCLLISRDQALVVTDFRYWEQVSQQATGFTLHKQTQDLWESVAGLILQHSWKKVAFEAEDLSFQDYQKLSSLLPQINLLPIQDQVKQVRWSKEPEEIALLEKAARITDLAWEKTMKILKPGIAERDLALEFDYQLRLNGAEGNAFSTIVASGTRSALPHAEPSEKKIQPGEWVLLDGGALYQGYHGDMTRTVVLGQADVEQKRIYNLVLKAQALALDGLKAGLIGKEVDALARDFLTRAGYGEQFGHGLGHSVGLEIHENPRLSKSESQAIPVGAAITVEPGVYIPGWGGVRIEDLVIVNEDGIRNLTGSPKEILLEL